MTKKPKKKKAKKKKRRKKPLLSRLKKQADKALSEYMRELTRQRFDDICPLCSIDNKSIQCCFHFISRRRAIIRWDDRNVIGACHTCNFNERRFPDVSRAWFIRHFGLDLYLELVDTAIEPFIPTKEYLYDIIEKYKKKLEELNV